jgi:hypothetical protein
MFLPIKSLLPAPLSLFKFTRPAPMAFSVTNARYSQPSRMLFGNHFTQAWVSIYQMSKRINGTALEMIMRDVLHGMHGFTNEVCRGSETASMDILAVEETANADQTEAVVIPFPGSDKKA